MKKLLLFLLCAGWSSQTLPMLEEPSPQDPAESPLVFKVNQPFLQEFAFKCTKYTLHADGKHFFEIQGKAVHGDPHNEHPILRNFTITITLIPQSPQMIFVESSIRANGYIFSGVFAKPADINIQFNYSSGAETHQLDKCIAQLLDIALLFERDEVQWCCKECKKRLWYQADAGFDVIINQHYLSDQGQFYCGKCGKQDSTQLINSITIPFASYRHISSRIELAQRYGGIW